MISATQIRNGMIIIFNNEPHKVIDFRFAVTGRGSNSIPVKLRNVLNGQYAEVRYRSDDKVEMTHVGEEEFEYLYKDGDGYCFMNSKSYEQITLNQSDVEEVMGYILPNSVCKVQLYEGRPIGIRAPVSVQLKVAETEPVIKGATASGKATKTAVLETGLKIQVPMFICVGDTVIINTESGEYQGRPGRQ